MTTLAELMNRCGVKIEDTGKTVSTPYEKQDGWRQTANPYRLKVRFGKRSFEFDFWQGCGIREEPTDRPAEVLDCLLLDASCGDMTLEEHCAEFGYDPDSRRVERDWKACVKTAAKMRRLLGEFYDEFMYADRP